ncbi:MAG: ABC transporter ATP-binding protein [Bacillota bacterium]
MAPASDASTNPIISISNLAKSFGGLQAVKKVDLKIYPGERHSIIGPNGAGKTTLFNMISGELIPTAGSIRINDVDVTKMPSYKRVPLGLARTFQVTNLFFDMSVLENVVLALQGLSPAKFVMWKPMTSYKNVYNQAEHMLKQFDVWDLRDERVDCLSYGDQRLLEVILGLSSNPSILALDEPTAGLSSAETEKMVSVLTKIDSGLTILLIEHDMRVAFALTQSMTVLADGEIVARGTVEEIQGNKKVQEIYLGTGDKDDSGS